MARIRSSALLLRLVPALFSVFVVPQAAAADQHTVHFGTADGGAIEGTLFPGGKTLAVVLAHGAVFDKESWYPQARRLQQDGVTALAFDFRGYGASRGPQDGGHLYQDVLGATAFLEREGYTHIALVGGSMGGAAVLNALAHRDDAHIVRALLLAPAGGEPIASPRIDKLFVVSAGDGLRSTVQSLYDRSAEPKKLEILPGSAHAQHIFAGPEANPLTDLVLRFLHP